MLRKIGQNLPLAQSLHPAEDFRSEALSLDAGDSQKLSQFWRQTSYPLCDHCLYARRKHPPVQCRPLVPIAIVILDQVATGLHRAQQLDGKQRVAVGNLK